MKTLNEIEYNIEYDTLPNEVQDLVEEDIKKEAIKWVKALMKVETRDEYESFEVVGGLVVYNYDVDYCSQLDSYAMINWIKHFFNITDKDLE